MSKSLSFQNLFPKWHWISADHYPSLQVWGTADHVISHLTCFCGGEGSSSAEMTLTIRSPSPLLLLLRLLKTRYQTCLVITHWSSGPDLTVLPGQVTACVDWIQFCQLAWRSWFVQSRRQFVWRCLIPWPPPSSSQKRKLEYPSAVPKGPAFGRCSILPPLLTDLAPASLVTVISFVSPPLCIAALLYCWEAVCSRGSFHSVVLQRAGLKRPDMKRKKTSILFKHWFLLLSTACNKQTYFSCPAPRLFVSLHKTTIIGQCSIDKSWMALINQLDNAICGSVQMKEVMGEAREWSASALHHCLHATLSLLVSFYTCVRMHTICFFIYPHLLHSDSKKGHFQTHVHTREGRFCQTCAHASK